MATYLQGVTDYIPQIQPFTPDYNFYSGALNFKQSKHDASRKQLSNIYGSLLNAPLTREDNAETRDKFFQTIEQDIQKMAGMDLSLAQNAEAAQGVFNQMLDNKAIVKDMVWTKQYQSQQQRAQGFKNCVDPEKCGGSWWEGGERLLQYNREAFKAASAQDAMNFGNAQYVAAQDVTKKALALAKEADLNVSVDQVTGQWITTTKNGPMLIQPLQNLFMGSIAKDPKVKEYYNAQAELGRKDFMYSNKEQYGSLESAEQAYISEKAAGIEQMFAGTERALQDDITNTQSKTKKLEDGINNSPPYKKSNLEAIRDDYNMIESGYTSTLGEVKNANGEIAVAKRNNKYTGGQIDRIMSAYNLGTDINGIATTLAFKDYEVSQKANPYGVEAASFRNRMLMEEYKHRNSMELATYKNDLKITAERLMSGGGPEQNSPLAVDVAGGTTITEDGKNSEYGHVNRGFDEFSEDRNELRSDLSANEKTILSEVVTRTKKAAENGDVQAKEDLVAMADNYLNALQIQEGTIGNTQGRSADEGSLVNTLTSGVATANSSMLKANLAKANTLDEKYQLIKDQKFDPNTVRGGQVDNLYQNTMKGMINPDESGNPIIRDYLAPVWEKTTKQRRNIQAKTEALSQYDEWYGQEAGEVIQAMKSDPAYSGEMVDAMESYVNQETGHTNTKKEFVANMTAKGYSENEAVNLYGGDSRKEWNDPDEWGDGTWNTARSIVDGVATTAWGIFNIGTLGLAAAVTGETGFDYDSPTDVANWDGYEKEGATTEGIAMWGEYDSQRFAKAGVMDEWKRAFSKHASPDGDRAWLGITGAGDLTAMGQQYTVDAASYRSTGTQGTIQFLQNAMNADATFDMGDFKGTVPEDFEGGQAIGQRILNDMINMKSGASRPIATVTYADIAGGDENTVGMNIKITNQSYLNKYKGSEKNEGLFRPYMDQLATEGLTVYMDRDQANNTFTNGTKGSSLEKMMEWTGKVDFDQSSYLKNFAIRSDKNSGNYVASGMVQAGLKDDGTPDWQYYESAHAYTTDLNDLVSKFDDMIASINSQNTAIDDKYVLQNRN
jgi:hypothetical protein